MVDKAHLDQALAATAKPEPERKAHQVRQSVLPELPTRNLLTGDKSTVVALRTAFTYDAINKGSKVSAAYTT